MPIYEYHCNDCQKRVSIFHRSLAAAASPTCPQCGGPHLQRLLSTFAIVRSEESRWESTADDMERWGDLDENDPRQVAAWARRLKGELGDEVGPEFDEYIEQMESGTIPGADAENEFSDDWDADLD